MKGRIVVDGIVKSRSGGYCFRIRALDEDDLNFVKDRVVNNLVLSGVVCTVEMGFYDRKREECVFVSD